MDKMIAYCGLDCSKCSAYIATVNEDEALRAKTAKLWSELNNIDILPEQINCLGCVGEGVKTEFCESLCGIRKCVIKKGFTNCGACDGYKNCETLKMIISNNTEALRNLEGSN